MIGALHTPYPTHDRQHEADRLGMTLFLASETMLFGAVIAAALVLQGRHAHDFATASGRLSLWLGGLNTAILLTSSLAVAIGVAAGERAPRTTARAFAGAALLGLAFLGVKAVEYAREYREGLMPNTARAHFTGPVEHQFMGFYFCATGLHALHLAAGIVLLGGLAWRLRSERPPTASAVANAGLYWHLVDVVWVFLYPILYLTRG